MKQNSQENIRAKVIGSFKADSELDQNTGKNINIGKNCI